MYFSSFQDVTPNMCKTEDVTGDAMLSQLAKMTVIITHLIVEFAKNLPGFTRISKEDQIVLLKVSITVMILSFQTYRSRQTVQTQIRLLLEEQSGLLEEQSDQGLHCLLFHLQLFNIIPQGVVGFRTKGSLVRTPAGAHFVVALSKSHLLLLSTG